MNIKNNNRILKIHTLATMISAKPGPGLPSHSSSSFASSSSWRLIAFFLSFYFILLIDLCVCVLLWSYGDIVNIS